MSKPGSFSKEKKIINLKEGEQNVTVVGRVLDAGEPKVISTKRGPRTISEALIGDDSGRVKVTLWGEKAGSLEEGKVVRIENAWTTSFKGKVQLNVGSKSKVEETEDSSIPPKEDIPDREPTAPSPHSREGQRFRKPGRRPRPW
uniref:Single-stranded DNA-binding protein n=1 Tax=Fervidicoccus fontis TaxID=683846 RepID=A0A7J3ZKU4_9CREN